MYEVDAYLQELITEKELPGAVLHVQHQGKTVFHRAYGGFIDSKQQNHTTKTMTPFDLASLTKVMATLPSILWLIDNTSVELDHPIQTYIPELKHPDMTIRHALEHSTGLPADLDPPVQRLVKRDVLHDILNTDLSTKPGSEVQYSDLGMILLGKVIEKVSGMSLSTFTDTHLFKPWGLTGNRIQSDSK